MKPKAIIAKTIKLGKNRVFCRTFLIAVLFFLIFFFKRRLVVDLILITELVLIDFFFSRFPSRKRATSYSRVSITSVSVEDVNIELKKLYSNGSVVTTKRSVAKKSTNNNRSRKLVKKKNKGYGWLLTIIATLILIFTSFYDNWVYGVMNENGSVEKLFLINRYTKERRYLSTVFIYSPPINLSITDFSNWLLESWAYRSISNKTTSNSDNSGSLSAYGIEYLESEFDTFISLRNEGSFSDKYLNTTLSVPPFNFMNISSSAYQPTHFKESDRISIVIPAHNEDEFISKTIIYTIEATPRELLREIIIVDDYSENPVYDILEKELPDSYKRFIKIIRLKKCEGLIRSKIIGADAAVGPNIFFLDGHCKPKKGWSEALVYSIRENYKRIVCPIVQSISNSDWSDIGTAGAKMMIEWNFAFHWYDDGLPEIPITSGGILMITKKWWEESGKYDPGMLFWGGENIEQSFRVWLCGGEIHVVRNSLVGHIFDRSNLNKRNNDFEYKKMLIDNMNSNHQRAAFVWLSEQFYETYFKNYHVMGYLPASFTKGLTERLSIKHTLKCKPFEWYVEKFRPAFERQRELYYSFHHIQHLKSRLCLSIRSKVYDLTNTENKNYFEIPMTVVPNDVSSYNIKRTIDYEILALDTCNYLDEAQKWAFILGNRMLYNYKSRKCLDKANYVSLIDKIEDKDKMYLKNGNTEFKNKLELPILFECDWNLVMRARNYNQFWAWKEYNLEGGRVVSWEGSEHRSNITGGAEQFKVPTDKGIDSDSYCLYSNATLGSYKESTVYYSNCGIEDISDEYSFKKLWTKNLFDEVE
ncbi:membrane-associated protein [Cryptosporidium canis]|nr:membrane-associated protein [Cryptosporidium canis]